MSKTLGLDLYLSQLQKIATAGYGMGLNIRRATPTMSFKTYPAQWMKLYTGKGYMQCDPLIGWGYSRTGTCRWSELDVPDPLNVLGQAQAFDMNYGIVISHGPIASRSIAGLAKKDREFTDSEVNDCQEIIERLHEETIPPENLTEAQIEALRLVSDGWRHAEVAEKLTISESALKARLKSARNRLMARTTTEAVQRASEYNLL